MNSELIKTEVQVKINYYFIRESIVAYAICHAVMLEIVLRNFGLDLGLISGSFAWAGTLALLSLS